ncbi:MAG: MerR family transcriptional regulator [Clostridiales bacterium]|nr:MerR family transcriptional regulator [Clostridiales bacterium]
MKGYYTISDFAKLRNININSLRYYERLGLLTPTFIDRDTKYRYYTADQLSILDIILLCIDLEIPLKDLASYQTKDLSRNPKLLEEYKNMAMERIMEIQTGFKKIEYIQKCREEQAPYVSRDGIYQREIRTRYLYLTEYDGDTADSRQFDRAFRERFQFAQDNGLTPVMSGGFAFSFSGNEPPYTQLYLEVLTPERGDSNPEVSDKLMKVPTMIFSCLRIVGELQTDFVRIIRQVFPPSTRRLALVAKQVQYESPREHMYHEIQVLDGFQTLSH